MQALKQHRLTQSEHDVLACARRQGAPFIATPGLLLEEVRITSGALTTCVNRLIDRDLLIRLSCQEDKRSRPVQLTEAGKTLIDEVTRYRFILAEQVMAGLTFGERQTLDYLLDKINHRLGVIQHEQSED
ncbi:MarR family winged helix-turn-helix transcriptional regulator [Alteromonas sp. CYL-A6]|uniref:MarR family winged helix-turn-helix transcriptional regulator n=1 Tax=Alteromonas nitratireducens TaxID=3390813 RepID=UPI0034C1104B